MSRAQWLAFGSALAVVGCSAGDAAGPSNPVDATAQSDGSGAHLDDAPSAEDAQGSVVTDVASEFQDDAAKNTPTSVDAGDGAALDVIAADAAGDASATFACANSTIQGSTRCDRTKQWCYGACDISGSVTYQCESLDTTCAYPPVGDADCSHAFYWDAAACAPGDRRCACLTVLTTGYSCIDDDAGGVKVAAVSCHSCYGAPPARLERLRDSLHHVA